MIIKIVLGFIMLAILVSLALAGRGIIKGEGAEVSSLVSFKWRIGLSVTLFICLFFAFASGFLQPHGL